ncbi:MAG TPA: HepT-like ribonuclease domain-containing protein [Thermoanaerobaculia bacterium]
MLPDHGFLQDMLEEARLALTFVAGMSQDEFLGDVKTQHAVVRSLEVIGEAANQISDETRARLSTVPWAAVIGQRHVAIHHYRKLQMPRIWRTVHEALPPLIDALERHLHE